jgi:hypothetical protein
VKKFMMSLAILMFVTGGCCRHPDPPPLIDSYPPAAFSEYLHSSSRLEQNPAMESNMGTFVVPWHLRHELVAEREKSEQPNGEIHLKEETH